MLENNHLMSLEWIKVGLMYKDECFNLDCFDQVGCAVGHFFGWLHKVSFSHRVCSVRRGQSASITQRWGVLSNNGGSWEHLKHAYINILALKCRLRCCRNTSFGLTSKHYMPNVWRYLGRTTVWVNKILASHLDCLISTSELDRIH